MCRDPDTSAPELAQAFIKPDNTNTIELATVIERIGSELGGQADKEWHDLVVKLNLPEPRPLFIPASASHGRLTSSNSPSFG